MMINIVENDGTLRGPSSELYPYNDDSALTLLYSKNKCITPRQLGLTYLDHLCYSNKGKILSYEDGQMWHLLSTQEFVKCCRNFAQFLSKKSKRFATVLLLNNHHFFFVPVVGTWLSGSSVSLLQPSNTKEIIEAQLSMLMKELHLEEILIVTENDCLNKIPMNFGNVAQVISLHPVKGFVSLQEIIHGSIPRHTVNNEDTNCQNEIAVVFWTSGSTGEPKGVLYTATNILKSIHYCSYIPQEIQHALKNYEPSNLRLMILTNFFHPGGFTEGLRNILPQKRIGIIIRKSSPDLASFSSVILLKAIQVAKPHMIICSPEFAVQLNGASDELSKKFDLSSVIAIYPIGGAINDNYANKAKQQFPSLQMICRGYGSTETLSISLGTSNTHLGTLFPTYQLRVLDSNGCSLGPNSVGDIVVKPGFGMRRYIGNYLSNVTSDGFFYMGDVGYYDSFGRIFFKCRSKDLIKIHNHHVYPQEMENFLSSKCPLIKDIGIFGRKDHDGIETLAAVIVLHSSKEELDVHSLIENICMEASIPSYKWIKGGVKVSDLIPRNANGKILRGRLPLIFRSIS